MTVRSSRSRSGLHRSISQTGSSRTSISPAISARRAGYSPTSATWCFGRSRRRGADGYVLVAAALCFPSSWSLADKIGRPMIAIHEHVPGYRERLAARIDRIFDNLRVEQPVCRVNWSIYPDADLHHPEPKQRPRNWFAETGELISRAFVRVERQTLRRLPASGDILFTIKVLVDPLEGLRRHPNGAQLARGLRDQIAALDRDQLAYKSMLEHRDGMVRALDA